MTFIEKLGQEIICALDIVVVAFVLASNGFERTNPQSRGLPLIPHRKNTDKNIKPGAARVKSRCT